MIRTRNYICTKCMSKVPGEITVLTYIPKRERHCPNCGSVIRRENNKYVKRFLADWSNTHQQNEAK